MDTTKRSGPTLAGWQFTLLAAAYVVVAGNLNLAAELGRQAGPGVAAPALVEGTSLVLLLGVQVILFAIFGGRRVLKPLFVAFAVLTAVVAYFDRSLGVIFDAEMIRNVVDTVREHNGREALDLASLPLFLYVLAIALPALALCLYVRIRPESWAVDLRNRFATIAAAIVVVAAVIAPTYRDLSYFWREHRDLRVHAMPMYPVLSAVQLARQSFDARQESFHDFQGPAVQARGSRKPVLGVLVVGETARADHFSLNGYDRATNRWLATDDVVSFAHVKSCGTSTAYSVPCMFSLDRGATFDPDNAEYEFNVLDVLSRAGIEVSWIDANSGCKGVCQRVQTIDLNARIPADRELARVYDEDLLPYLDAVGEPDGRDLLIVMHMLGSHGPAYSERYPQDFAEFQPSCTNPAPQECARSEVVNAYDNTIAYTDYVLHRLIGELRAREGDYDGFLLYVSDHGESLGENGVYLHGWPNSIAPPEQTSVPMIAWMSEQLMRDHGLPRSSLESRAAEALTHDIVSHSLLGLFDVRTDVYDQALDIFRAPADALPPDPRAGTHAGS